MSDYLSPNNWDLEHGKLPRYFTGTEAVINEITDALCVLGAVPLTPIYSLVALERRISRSVADALSNSLLTCYRVWYDVEPPSVEKDLVDHIIIDNLTQLYDTCVARRSLLGFPPYILIISGDGIYRHVLVKLISIGFKVLLLYPRKNVTKSLLSVSTYCFCLDRVVSEPIVWELPQSQTRRDLGKFNGADIPPPPPPGHPFRPQYPRSQHPRSQHQRSQHSRQQHSRPQHPRPQPHNRFAGLSFQALTLTGLQDNAEFLSGGGTQSGDIIRPGKPVDPSGMQFEGHEAAVRSCLSLQGSPDKSSVYSEALATYAAKKGPGKADQEADNLGSQGFHSVGDNHSYLTPWDARTGTSSVTKVAKAQDADLDRLDWNPHDDNLILTGSADITVQLYDRRNLTSKGHKAAVRSAQESPNKSSVYRSSAEDGLLNINDYNTKSAPSTKSPAGLYFHHAGHRDNVVDFHRNVSDPWTIVSGSDDCETAGGVGTLQMWSDLIYRPEEEVVRGLEMFTSHVLES